MSLHCALSLSSCFFGLKERFDPNYTSWWRSLTKDLLWKEVGLGPIWPLDLWFGRDCCLFSSVGSVGTRSILVISLIPSIHPSVNSYPWTYGKASPFWLFSHYVIFHKCILLGRFFTKKAFRFCVGIWTLKNESFYVEYEGKSSLSFVSVYETATPSSYFIDRWTL